MKRLGIVLLLTGVSTLSHGADVGLGFKLGGYGYNAITVPVRLSNGMTLEGQASYYDARQDYQVVEGYNSFNKSIEREIGLGIFWRKQLTSSNELFYGPKLSYVSNTWNSSGGSKSSHGYSLGALIGVEYFPVRNISIGGEAGVNYEYMNNGFGTGVYAMPADDSSYRKFETFSDVFIRIYF